MLEEGKYDERTTEQRYIEALKNWIEHRFYGNSMTYKCHAQITRREFPEV